MLLPEELEKLLDLIGFEKPEKVFYDFLKYNIYHFSFKDKYYKFYMIDITNRPWRNIFNLDDKNMDDDDIPMNAVIKTDSLDDTMYELKKIFVTKLRKHKINNLLNEI